MNVENLRLLICTNGSELTIPALEYGAWLAYLLQLEVSVLGVVERRGAKPQVDQRVQHLVARLSEKGLAYQTRFEMGDSTEIIPELIRQSAYLTVLGPLGKPALERLIRGRSFRRLLAAIETPLVYVRRACLPMRRILLCMGGLGYASGVEHLSIFIAKRAGAEVTLLHVVEPVTLDYPTSRKVQGHWDHILSTDTPQGRNLSQSLDELRAAGLSVDFKVRHGSPVHEIMMEIDQGAYEMVALGSAYSASSLRHLYLPNVTAEIAEGADIPLLTVRQDHELISS